jgi:aminoglycoside phosphotransferase (APT) family kinase protein
VRISVHSYQLTLRFTICVNKESHYGDPACEFSFIMFMSIKDKLGHAVAQLAEVMRHNPEDRGFDSRWCHWNFSLT